MINRGELTRLQCLFLRVALGATTLATLAVGLGFAVALCAYRTFLQ